MIQVFIKQVNASIQALLTAVYTLQMPISHKSAVRVRPVAPSETIPGSSPGSGSKRAKRDLYGSLFHFHTASKPGGLRRFALSIIAQSAIFESGKWL